MSLINFGEIISGIGSAADELFTSDEERLKAGLEEKRIESKLLQAQMEVNKQEAAHSNIFVAGWRPFIGWVGGIALAYQFVLYPILVWGWAIAQSRGWIPCYIDANQVVGACTFTTPPVFDAGPLFAIVTGMLGIGGMRSYDKLKNTDTKRMRK